MPIETGSAKELASVAELRRQHVSLLAKWREKEDAQEKALEAEGLRQAGKALGKLLEDPAERDTAQSIIDYWTSAIATLPAQSFAELLSLDRFDESLAKDRARMVDDAFGADPAEIEIAEKILLRLLRVGSDDRIEEGPPVLLGDVLGRAAGTPGAQNVLRRLTEAGILFVRPGSTPEESSVEVTSRAVARRSTRVNSLLSSRRDLLTVERLRATAQLWKQHGEAPGYLLSGPSLDTASLFLTDHRDAENRTLNDYILASKGKAERDRSIKLWATILVPLLSVALIVGLVFQSFRVGWQFRAGNEAGYNIGVDVGGLEVMETSAPEPTAQRQVQLDQTVTAAAEPVGPVGFVWIGSEHSPQLRDARTARPVAPGSIKPGQQFRVNSRKNMRLRSGLPSEGNFSAQEIGQAPAKSLVVAIGEPVPQERPSGIQYWLKVRVVPRVYIQFADAEVKTLAAALRDRGFDVQPSERRAFNGGAQVRFYSATDAPLAAQLASAAADALRAPRGPPGRPADVRCLQLPREYQLPPTVLELWYNLRTVTHSGEPGAPAAPDCGNAVQSRPSGGPSVRATAGADGSEPCRPEGFAWEGKRHFIAGVVEPPRRLPACRC
jgi:hypothetical protein